jgi:hypothetical protein
MLPQKLNLAGAAEPLDIEVQEDGFYQLNSASSCGIQTGVSNSNVADWRSPLGSILKKAVMS